MECLHHGKEVSREHQQACLRGGDVFRSKMQAEGRVSQD